MRLTLIYPSSRKSNPNIQWWKQPRAHRYPGLGLITVAALCPSSAKINLIDDDYENINYAEKTDLVGISTLTLNARRAYEMADQFRKRGTPVVLGGMHATARPEEALKHADSVVIGEAEDTWPKLLEDWNKGRIKSTYVSLNSSDLANRPIPRRDLLDRSKYATINTVQAVRGCVFDCEFCSQKSLFGPGTRCRPIEEVIEEIRGLEGKYFVLNDDNLGQLKEYYKELFRRLIPLKRQWVGEASWNIVKDDEILDLLELSGCQGLAIGFESLDPQPGVKKISSVCNNYFLYKEAVKKLHDHGIGVMGNFVFGFDNENETIFKKVLRFAIESKLDIGQFCILVPFPGTPLYNRLMKEERIIEEDWNNYSGNNLCFKLKNMSAGAFLKGFRWVKTEFYSYQRIAQRIIRGALRGMSFHGLGLLLMINLGYRKYIKSF